MLTAQIQDFLLPHLLAGCRPSRPPYGLGALCRVTGAGLGRCLLMLSVTVLIS